MAQLTVDIGGSPGIGCRGFCEYCYFKKVRGVQPLGCRYCLPFKKGCDYCTRGVKEEYPGFKDLAKAYREENGLAPDAVIPADAATRSASGLDPDISPANAELQVARVAKARGLGVDKVRQILADHTSGRTLGIFGEPRVNVLELNLALDSAK